MIPDTFTFEVVKSMFNPLYFRRGQEYFKNDRVTLIDVCQRKENWWIVTAEVNGSNEDPYTVEILIEQKGKVFSIRGECECPVQVSCKHVVATLLKVIAQGGKIENEINFGEIRQLIKRTALNDGKSSGFDSWLNTVSEASHIKPVVVQNKRFQLYFELFYPVYWRQISCRPLLFRMLKSCGRSKTAKKTLLDESNEIYFTKEDKNLIGRIMVECQGRYSTHPDNTEFRGEAGEMLLEDLLKTGRCFWSGSDHDVSLGEALAFSFQWTVLSNGVQKLTHNQKSSMMLFSIENIWYFDSEANQIGRVICTIPTHVARSIVNAPEILPEKSAQARQILKKTLPKELLPNVYTVKETITETPVPFLHFAEKAVRVSDAGWSYHEEKRPVATVHFRYGDVLVSWEDSREIVHALKGKDLVEYRRNFSAEEAALYALLKNHNLTPVASLNVPPSAETVNGFFLGTDQDPITFILDELPKLRNAGWVVDVDSECPWDILDVSMDDWYANLEEESSGVDWFGLELGILMPSGEKINLLPILQEYLLNPPKDPESTKKIITHLADGRKISLPVERVRSAANTLVDLFNRTTGPVDTLRLSRLEAMRLAELQKALNAAALRWQGGQKILETATKLSNVETLSDVRVPELFHGQLRPYQQTGLNWLQFLRENHFGGVLSDDMGLGKTIQAIAHISVEKKTGRLLNPVLVVAPTSLMFNWQSELQRFSPDLKVLLLHGSKRKQYHDAISEYDVVLTTYPLLVRDKDVLLKHHFHLMILDEAQAIKNARSQMSHIVIQIRAKNRLCMTGTPMENHLGELWSLFHFMMPGFLGTETQFRQLFRTPIEKDQNDARRQSLARIVSPFLLRRKKADVVKELPDKTEIIQKIELNSGQRDLYETIRLSMQKKLRESIQKLGLARSHIMILDALLKLRQICCDPRLLKENTKAHKLPSAKLELLMSMLPELVEEGRRILLFSQFTEMLGLIENELDSAGIPYVILTGQTRDRKKPVEQFQSGKVPVFLISLKAGGTGLNLTAADTVMHYDPWWNPAVENQATDRAHRIGQQKKVFVYRLVAQGTVEEKIIELQQRKHALAESLLSSNNKGGAVFSIDDLRNLLDSDD